MVHEWDLWLEILALALLDFSLHGALALPLLLLHSCGFCVRWFLVMARRLLHRDLLVPCFI
jgi:hypothetical protein